VRADANGRDYTQYSEPQDIPTLPPQYYDTGDSTRTGIIPGDGFYDTGTAWTWREHFARELTFRAELTAFLAEKSQLKAGAELRLQELQYAEIFAPWVPPLGLNNDAFCARPRLATLYAQHQLTHKGLVLHYGLRAEAWAPGRLVDHAIADPAVTTITEEQRHSYLRHTLAAFGLRWKVRLQPRLGVAHPITPQQMLYFNYGHFSKLPRPQYVYAKLSPQAARSSYQRFGNPDLDPETSIAYELGLRNQLTSDDVLLPGALHTVGAIFAALPAVRWLTGRPANIDADDRLRIFPLRTGRVRGWIRAGRYHGRGWGFIRQEGTFWRRDLWQQIGGALDESRHYSMDFDLWRRMAAHAELVTVDRPLAAYRSHAAQKTAQLDRYYAEAGIRTPDAARLIMLPLRALLGPALWYFSPRVVEQDGRWIYRHPFAR
jgi:hypothetical protein